MRPASAERIQRGAGLFGQFLPDDGAEVVWDEFHAARLQDGSIRLGPKKPAQDVPPIADEVA